MISTTGAPQPGGEPHKDERDLIRNASTSLLRGETIGPLTVTRLAEVAGVQRWKLTHRHVDLKEAFQTAAGATPVGQASRERLEERLAAERSANAALRTEVGTLKEHLERYAEVIAELAADLAESEARVEALSNVKILRPRG